MLQGQASKMGGHFPLRNQKLQSVPQTFLWKVAGKNSLKPCWEKTDCPASWAGLSLFIHKFSETELVWVGKPNSNWFWFTQPMDTQTQPYYRASPTFSSKCSPWMASSTASSSSCVKSVLLSAACMTVLGSMTSCPEAASFLSLALVAL